MKETFDILPKGKLAIIVINDNPLLSTNDTVRSIIKCQHCRDLINILVVDYALALLGKKAVYHTIYHSSFEQLVKDFISGSSEESEILITSFELIKGFEHPIIIDTTDAYEISSRTSSKLVKIYSNWFLNQMVIYEQLLKDVQHQCHRFMERDLRPQIDLKFSSLIGDFFKLIF